MEENINLNELNGKEVCDNLFGKNLNSKKNILEYIDVIKNINKDNISSDKMQEIYTFIYKSIEDMGSTIKINTIVFLKNQLKAQLGKYVKEKDPKSINYFIEFFKEAYPAKLRGKGYNRVINDISKITEEQIWTTLAYISTWCLKNNNLSNEQKEHIIEMIEVLVSKNKIKYINQVKSMSNLLNILEIKIVNVDDKFKVKVKGK